MEAWRQWLDNLPHSADDLRERALLEFHFGRNARIMALAMLRDGRGISAAAKAARVQPSAVQRWLDIGMGYGLEAIFAAPMRRCDLTEEQRQRIEAWIASVRRSTSGICAWRPEHAQQEIAAHCGLLLSLDAVHRLFSNHRSLRQRHPEPV
jgi:transposase